MVNVSPKTGTAMAVAAVPMATALTQCTQPIIERDKMALLLLKVVMTTLLCLHARSGLDR